MRHSTERGLVVALVLLTATYAIAEDIVLTTYYPSPRGVYEELRIRGNVARLSATTPGSADGNAAVINLFSLDSDGDGLADPGDRLWQLAAVGNADGVGSPTFPRRNDLMLFKYDGTQPLGAQWSTPLTIDFGTGNVGIGTTAPEATLHIVGGNGALTVDPQANPTAIFFRKSGRYDGAINVSDSFNAISGLQEGRLDFYSAGTPPASPTGPVTWRRTMTITNGKLGIGTTTPGATLDVAGNMLLSGSLTLGGVARTTWPSQVGLFDGGFVNRTTPGLSARTVTRMEWANCSAEQCPGSPLRCNLGTSPGVYVSLRSGPAGASCHLVRTTPGANRWFLHASCPPGWKIINGGANSYRTFNTHLPSDVHMSVPDTYRSWDLIPENTGPWRAGAVPPNETEGWTGGFPGTAEYDGFQVYALCGTAP